MSYHNILLSPVLAPVVLEFLSPGPLPLDASSNPSYEQSQHRAECQHALASLARVCRSISGDALRVLWRDIDNFSFLLYAFEPYSPRKKMFVNHLTEAHWTRFQTYAWLVRSLHVSDAVANLDASVWAPLTRRYPQGPLLPRLERLSGFVVEGMGLYYANLFSTTIKSLGLLVPYSSDEDLPRMIIQMAEPALQSITDLVVDDRAAERLGTQDIVRYWELRQLHSLRVVHRTTVTISLLRSLSTFSCLRALHLAIYDTSEMGLQEENFPIPSLQELTLSGRPRDICALMAATTLASLESFTILIPSICDDFDESFRLAQPGGARTLDRMCARLPPTLHHFRATFDCDCHSGHSLDSNYLLLPLVVAYGLRTVSFTFGMATFHLTDEALATLADAWPNLTEFEIVTRMNPLRETYHRSTDYARRRFRRSPRPRSRAYGHHFDEAAFTGGSRLSDGQPTIKSIARFARGHPHLTRLSLPFLDLDAVPDLESVPFLNHGLRHLTIGTLASGVGLLDHALALDMLFPRLDLAAIRDSPARPVLSIHHQNDCDRNGELQLLLLALQLGRTGAASAGSRARGQVEGNPDTASPQGPEGASGGPSAIRLARRQRSSEAAAVEPYESIRPLPIPSSIRSYSPSPVRRSPRRTHTSYRSRSPSHSASFIYESDQPALERPSGNKRGARVPGFVVRSWHFALNHLSRRRREKETAAPSTSPP
ncbi:hypothetical protein C8Q77DRAFT_1065735 [Trametes polyzona]|nr:hypothetical protein C8Q77DRAFT_1065735 [Trametes polyzona]